MRRLIFLFVPLFLFSQSGYVLKTGVVSQGGGFSHSSSYNLTGVSGIITNGASRNQNYGIQSGLPYISIVIGIKENTFPPLPWSFRLFPLSPNPMFNRVSITFTLPEKSHIQISIYDISGRMIWKHTGEYSAGKHRIYWDGKDNNGNLVATGVYILRFQNSDHLLTRKLLLIR